MVSPLLFSVLVLLSLGYSIASGGPDGRVIAGLFASVTLVSLVAPHLIPFAAGMAPYAPIVDGAMFLVLWQVAKQSRSYWPLWVLGFHVSNIVTDVLIVVDVGGSRDLTQRLHAFWSIAELLVMPAGILLDELTSNVGRRTAP